MHYGIIWGVINYFDPFSLVHNTEPIKTVPKDYYITDALSDLEESRQGRPAIRRYFTNAVDFGSSRNGSRGCLMINSAVEMAPHDKESTVRVKAHISRMEDAFHRQLAIARQKDELESDRSLRDLARYLTGAAQGMGVMIKAGPERRALKAYVNTVLSALR